MSRVLLKLSERGDYLVRTQEIKNLSEIHGKLVQKMREELAAAQLTYTETFKQHWQNICEVLQQEGLITEDDMLSHELYFDLKKDELGMTPLSASPIPVRAVISGDKTTVDVGFRFDKPLEAEAAKAFSQALKAAVQAETARLGVTLLSPEA